MSDAQVVMQMELGQEFKIIYYILMLSLFIFFWWYSHRNLSDKEFKKNSSLSTVAQNFNMNFFGRLFVFTTPISSMLLNPEVGVESIFNFTWAILFMFFSVYFIIWVWIAVEYSLKEVTGNGILSEMKKKFRL